VLCGGALVLGALTFNELLAMRQPGGPAVPRTR
jgi:hypothetical protein